MTRRRYSATYTGARGRIAFPDVGKLDPRRYAVQPKLDGAYVEITTGAQGQAVTVRTRNGRIIPPKAHGLKGQIIGPPRATICGELAIWTEGARTTTERAGYRICELFDLVKIGRESLVDLPYRERRDRLWRAHAAIEHEGIPGRGFIVDRKGRRHEPSTGRYLDEGEFIPLNWRRAPIVEQVAPKLAGDLWNRIGISPWVEGLVVVALDAPLGRRGAKRKCKPVYSADCEVLRVTGRVVAVRWPWVAEGYAVVGDAGIRDLVPGELVEVGYEGWFDSGAPRFARILRRRADLQRCSAFQFVDLTA